MFEEQFEVEPDAVIGLAVIAVVGFTILTLSFIYHI